MDVSLIRETSAPVSSKYLEIIFDPPLLSCIVGSLCLTLKIVLFARLIIVGKQKFLLLISWIALVESE